jgi:hypothetical protein
VHSLETLSPQLEKDADIIIYGHTHEPKIQENGKLYINPGECGGWVNGISSIAILDTETCGVDIINLSSSRPIC